MKITSSSLINGYKTKNIFANFVTTYLCSGVQWKSSKNILNNLEKTSLVTTKLFHLLTVKKEFCMPIGLPAGDCMSQ